MFSQQKHYDFGMRTLKAILIRSGTILHQTQQEESLVLIQAIRDMMFPRLVPSDIKLFYDVVNYLFPGTHFEQKKEQLLHDELVQVIQTTNGKVVES